MQPIGKPMKKRILVAGLFHETHTFLETPTPLEAFSIRNGESLLDAAGDGSPLAGALEVASACGWHVLPAADFRATPSGTVEDEVFEAFCELVSSYDQHRSDRIDGIFLVLHGAMVCRSIPDVEGELITRLRRLPGADELPICGVLDLHGNISRRTIEGSQGFWAYRTNPHIDACIAAMNAATMLDQILKTGRKPTALFDSVPIMWPPTGTGTDDEPMRGLEAMAAEIAKIAAVNVMAGFSFADTFDTGVSFSAVTFGNPEPVRRHLRSLCDFAVRHREQGNVLEPPLETVMPNVLDCVAHGQTPVGLVEPADNVGGGAPGDADHLTCFVGARRRGGGRRHQ